MGDELGMSTADSQASRSTANAQASGPSSTNLLGKPSDYTNMHTWGKRLLTKLETNLASIHSKIDKNFDQLKHSLKTEISDSVDPIRDSITDIVRRLEQNEETSALNQQNIAVLEEKMKCVIQDNSKLKNKLRMIDSKSRMNNLIFKGVSGDTRGETDSDRMTKIKEIMITHLKLTNDECQNVKITKSVRINGPKVNASRPICVTFYTISGRQTIWGKRDKLKSTDYYLCEDYSPEVLKERRKLFQILSVAKTKAGYKDNVEVKFDKLICYGREYTCHTLHLLPDTINPRNTSEIFTATDVIFGGVNSNHHPFCNWKQLDTPLSFGGVNFPTSEHAYLYEHAKFENDEEVCRNILSTNDPAEAKWYSKFITKNNIQQWHKHSRDIMKQILRKKFQNEALATELKNTGERRLHEAGISGYWATGVSRGHKNAANPAAWTGKDMLGKILMEIRDEI